MDSYINLRSFVFYNKTLQKTIILKETKQQEKKER